MTGILSDELLAELIMENDAKMTTIADSLKAIDKNIEILTKSLSTFLEAYSKILAQQGFV